MNDRPEEAADAEGEKEDEGKEPGITELHRRDETADEAEDEADQADDPTEERESGEAAGFEKFAFRRRQDVGSIAHFFAGSAGLAGSGFFSARSA